MDAYPAIESIVHLMTSLPDESVESLLVTLDALVGVSDEGLRPSTAQLLRNTAESGTSSADGFNSETICAETNMPGLRK